MVGNKIELIERVKGDFQQACTGLLNALSSTPDDRLHWSPSETARTPLQVAKHAADAIESMHGNAMGNTFPIQTTEEADRYFMARDKEANTRLEVEDLLERNGKTFLAWLDTVTAEQLDEVVPLPFGLPNVPVSFAVSFMPLHLMWHTAQITYIQTIYGDRDWHMGD
jgi:hypothetical protein